jgi:hypothetical protein
MKAGTTNGGFCKDSGESGPHRRAHTDHILSLNFLVDKQALLDRDCEND